MDIRLLTTHILATDVLSTNILYNFWVANELRNNQGQNKAVLD